VVRRFVPFKESEGKLVWVGDLSGFLGGGVRVCVLRGKHDKLSLVLFE